jgi:polyisoprenoid-binding protein YceI
LYNFFKKYINMKSLSLPATLLLCMAAFYSCTNAPESDEATTTEAKAVTKDNTGEKWAINTTASTIEWVGTKVTGYHTGTVPLKSGEVTVKDGAVTGGRFVMDVAHLSVTGPKSGDTASNNKLQGHLKSADFFDVEKNPEGVFELTAVQAYSGAAVKDSTDPRQELIGKYKVTNPTHTVSGNLTLKGTTKNITFPARITVSANGVEAVAKFNINRKDWNIVYTGKPDDLIRDEIHLGLLIKAEK